jgi:hypothetical protein
MKLVKEQPNNKEKASSTSLANRNKADRKPQPVVQEEDVEAIAALVALEDDDLDDSDEKGEAAADEKQKERE